MKDSNGWKIVSTYSTREAVAEGFMVKVDSKASEESGIKFPVYLTRAVWDKYVEVPKGMEQLKNLSGHGITGSQRIKSKRTKSLQIE
jgi:hypothetical protein